MLLKIGVLLNFTIFTRKHLCWSLILIKLQALIPVTSTQLLSFEYCDIFKNSFFDRTTLVAACDLWAVFSEISFMIGTIKGATNLYFTRYSFVVVIFLIWVYQSLRFLPFILGKYFFIFCCFMCFLTVRSFEFDVIFIEFRHL